MQCSLQQHVASGLPSRPMVTLQSLLIYAESNLAIEVNDKCPVLVIAWLRESDLCPEALCNLGSGS